MINGFTGLLGQESASVYYQFARWQALGQWWHWLLLLVAGLCIAAYVIAMYRRDSTELSRPISWLLMGLRILAFVGILFYFFDLEKRTQRQLVKNSRVALLVDASQSMGLQDGDNATAGGPSRIDSVVAALSEGSFLKELRHAHDVIAWRFDDSAKPVEIATFKKFPDGELRGAEEGAVRAEDLNAFNQAQTTALVAAGLLFISVFAGLVHLVTRRGPSTDDRTAWSLLVCMVMLIASVVVMAVANLRSPDPNILAVWGLAEPDLTTDMLDPDADAEAEEREVDWNNLLIPRGGDTLLAEAVQFIVNHERGGPVAGVVLFSDGQATSDGLAPELAAANAADAGIKVFTVGLGSDQRPQNVRVVDLEAPPRVYPGDDFKVTGYVQATGLAGKKARLELYAAPTTESGFDENRKTLVDRRDVRFADDEDGKILAHKFEARPDEEGRITYILEVVSESNDLNADDNTRSAIVEVVEKQNKVLLIAGGPAREYRFLRNMLFRDADTQLDVWLQSGQPGISQESDKLRFEFPVAEELYEYDCIIAFDPDWDALDAAEVKMLETWVAEKAGGLIVVAGPVFTSQWAWRRRGDVKIDTIKALYPVVFYSFGSATLNTGRFGAESPWPLQFTREGMESEFLWLEDTAIASEEAWASFEGVYGYFGVKDPKPAAKVFARFSDPDTSIEGELPIYLAGQFYGAGRVFFQASGEMWRIRAVDDSYFETYYTKLIRWVSQGRLLQDSSRGMLIVDKDRCVLGDRVSIRAILTDAQHQPLRVPEVKAVVSQPNAARKPITLKRIDDAVRDGTYTNQYLVMQEGDYRIELEVPDSSELEFLTADFRARVPQREIENPQRNQPLLNKIAEITGGRSYISVQNAIFDSAQVPVNRLLDPADQVTYLPGTPDKVFERLLMTWLLGLICGVLCFEWLIRRLSRLA